MIMLTIQVSYTFNIEHLGYFDNDCNWCCFILSHLSTTEASVWSRSFYTQLTNAFAWPGLDALMQKRINLNSSFYAFSSTYVLNLEQVIDDPQQISANNGF